MPPGLSIRAGRSFPYFTPIQPAAEHRRVEEIGDERPLPAPAGEQAAVNERGEAEEKARAPLHAGRVTQARSEEKPARWK